MDMGTITRTGTHTHTSIQAMEGIRTQLGDSESKFEKSFCHVYVHM